MTSAAGRRIEKLEGALLPREAVLAWLADAQGSAGLIAHVRSIVDLPIEAAPLSLIGARVAAAVREALKGQRRDDVEPAARRAQGDAVFLFCLVLTLNGEAVEVARVEGLRAAAAFFWMAALRGGPLDSLTSDKDARERRDAWRLWRSVVERLTTDVQVEREARAGLERRYLGGHDVLFADAAAAWTSHVELVRRLAGLAEVIESGESAKAARRTTTPKSAIPPLDARIADLAATLADDARVRAYEVLGDRERAVSIMERRLRIATEPVT